MTDNAPDLPEPTYEDSDFARCWNPEDHEDKEFWGGLRFSEFRDYSADELEAMDLATFRRTWQAVEWRFLTGVREITVEQQRACIDLSFYFGGFRIADRVYESLRDLPDDTAGIGTTNILEAIRSFGEGNAPEMIEKFIPHTDTDNVGIVEQVPGEDSPVLLTNEARQVLRHAHELMKESGDSWISNEHLLLALIEVEKSDFQEHLRANGVKSSGLATILRTYLGITATRTLSDGLRAYQIYHGIELDLKWVIRDQLKRRYKEGWWTQGIRKKIQDACAKLRKEEKGILDDESYLHLVQMITILKDNWDIFGGALAKASGERSKGKATKWLSGINPVRNVIMHPVKRPIKQDDLTRLQDARRITSTFLAAMGIKE